MIERRVSVLQLFFVLERYFMILSRFDKEDFRKSMCFFQLYFLFRYKPNTLSESTSVILKSPDSMLQWQLFLRHMCKNLHLFVDNIAPYSTHQFCMLSNKLFRSNTGFLLSDLMIKLRSSA